MCVCVCILRFSGDGVFIVRIHLLNVILKYVFPMGSPTVQGLSRDDNSFTFLII